jgi:hypothetical protein
MKDEFISIPRKDIENRIKELETKEGREKSGYYEEFEAMGAIAELKRLLNQ